MCTERGEVGSELCLSDVRFLCPDPPGHAQPGPEVFCAKPGQLACLQGGWGDSLPEASPPLYDSLPGGSGPGGLEPPALPGMPPTGPPHWATPG